MRLIPQAPSRLTAELLLMVVALAWGIGFPVMKDAVNAYPVMMVLWLRFLLATGCMLPFCWGSLRNISLQTTIVGTILGCLLFTSFALLIFGLEQTTATNTGFLAGLAAVWVPLLAGPLVGKSPTRSAKVAVAFGLIGLFLMSGMKAFSLQQGDALVVAGSVFSALHILGLDRWSHHHNQRCLVFIQIMVMAILALFTNLVMGEALLPTNAAPRLLCSILIIAVFSTALAFWIQTNFQRYTTPTRASMIYNLEPLFSALFAMLLLNEILSFHVILGGTVILVGMYLPEMAAKRHKDIQVL
jgi:drug/metabolite transporter (DMT)-like permease